MKPRTVDSYKSTVRNYLKPALGAVKLQAVQMPQIQKFINGLTKSGLSPKTVKNIHGALHSAMQQAVEVGYIRFNPTAGCKLPKIEKAEIKPLDDEAISDFMKAIHGHKYENVYLVTLYTGMREGEVLGLTWDCIDFKSGTITKKHQLQKECGGNGIYHLVSTKNGKSRKITPAPSVLSALKKEQVKQIENRFKARETWDNPLNLVFTNELGHNLSAQTVYLHFKKIAAEIGIPEARFHDLRHPYVKHTTKNKSLQKQKSQAINRF